VLQRAFERFGLPERINTDNGPPWADGRQGGMTGLAVWLIRIGVRLSRSRALHPQTNGKDERFHRTFKAEVLAMHTFGGMPDAQNQFARWRHIYNHERPHQALQMQTPASRYRPSERAMPRQLPSIEYLQGDLVRQVQQGGWLSVYGREIRTSKALAGQPVACRPLAEDGDFALYFCHQKIGQFSLHQL
jgi:hypothetical protein